MITAAAYLGVDNIDRRGDIRQYALNGEWYGFIFIVDNPAHFQR